MGLGFVTLEDILRPYLDDILKKIKGYKRTVDLKPNSVFDFLDHFELFSQNLILIYVRTIQVIYAKLLMVLCVFNTISMFEVRYFAEGEWKDCHLKRKYSRLLIIYISQNTRFYPKNKERMY
jgi:hypothetical protein